MIDFEVYKKPAIGSRINFDGLIPAIAPLIGLSAKALAVGGAVLGLAAGMTSSKGNSVIDSTHTFALTERKNFALG